MPTNRLIVTFNNRIDTDSGRRNSTKCKSAEAAGKVVSKMNGNSIASAIYYDEGGAMESVRIPIMGKPQRFGAGNCGRKKH